MPEDETNLIPADEPVLDLQLTAAEMKVTYTALKTMFDDFGRDQTDLHQLVRGILDRLPSEHDMRAIDLEVEIEKLRALRGQ